MSCFSPLWSTAPASFTAIASFVSRTPPVFASTLPVSSWYFRCVSWTPSNYWFPSLHWPYLLSRFPYQALRSPSQNLLSTCSFARYSAPSAWSFPFSRVLASWDAVWGSRSRRIVSCWFSCDCIIRRWMSRNIDCIKDVIPMMAIDSSSLVEGLLADIAILGIGKLLSPFEF